MSNEAKFEKVLRTLDEGEFKTLQSALAQAFNIFNTCAPGPQGEGILLALRDRLKAEAQSDEDLARLIDTELPIGVAYQQHPEMPRYGLAGHISRCVYVDLAKKLYKYDPGTEPAMQFGDGKPPFKGR